ncbi:MAG: lipopolysaccharide biosynthesis protein [Flavobacteriales bacterium]
MEQLRHDVRRIRTPGTFSRNSFTVFSANTITIGSQIVLTPLIARIYGPEAYGVYGLFLALVMNLSSVADLGYSLAYVLPKDDKRFQDLVRLNLLILLAVTVFCLAAGLFRDRIYDVIPSWRPMGGWIMVLPVGFIFYSLTVFATQWLIRAKSFRHAAFSGAWSNLGMRSFNLVFGLLSKGALHGLMLGEVVVRGASMLLYWRRLIPYGFDRLFSEWSWASIKEAAIEYKRYPLLIFPERWVALFGGQLPLFLLADDLTLLGQYALGSSLLLIPLRLLGFTFSPVYLQKASETVDSDPELLGRITKGLFQRLFWIGVVPFTMLVFFGDELFHLVMGDAWRNAGVITAYLGAFFFFRLLTEPMIALFNVLRREHVMLIFGVVLTILRLAAMLTAMQLGLGSGAVVLAYSLVSLLSYIVLMVMLLNAARLPGLIITVRSIIYASVIAVLFAALRYAILGNWWPTL